MPQAALPPRASVPASRVPVARPPVRSALGDVAQIRPPILSQPVHPVSTIQNMPKLIANSVSLPIDQRVSILNKLNETEVKVCTKCRLNEGRKNTVFGEGTPEASLMFIGEGPGETEDETGRPFVGRAGQLLSKMIQAMGLSREQVYIANVVKCRPPGNRTPMADEVATCTPYLLQQIEVIRPKVIVTLGLPATQYMLGVSRPMRELRGVWHDWNGIKIMPTYHPSYVLRSYTPEVRGTVWGDLQKVMQELGMPVKGQAM
jgi:uracil-DNA glycosylase family 4